MFGLVLMLVVFLVLSLVVWSYLPRAKRQLVEVKSSKPSGRQAKTYGQLRVFFFQIGLAPLLALGLTYVFWQGWSSLVNFVAS